jgi:hypothetical protein
MPLHGSSTCAHNQDVKIVLYSLWYHHTETSERSKITKIQFYKYEHIVVKFMCEFFGCDYCVLLIINMLCHVEVAIWGWGGGRVCIISEKFPRNLILFIFISLHHGLDITRCHTTTQSITTCSYRLFL